MSKIREQGGTSCKLFCTDVRGKRKQQRLNRMKDEEERVVEGKDQVLAVMARYCEELGRSSEGDVLPDTVMEDVGGYDLDMRDKVSWEEVV